MHAAVLVCLAAPLAGKGPSRLPRAVPRPTPKERILSFDSRIIVNPDTSMRVVETIQVQATGNKMVHGISRDFPTSYKDRFGNNYSVLFDVLSLERDGNTEPYHSEPIPGGVHLKFGDSSQALPPGIHTYVLTYDTTRQLGFFKDHDELYWNAVPTGSIFPIDVATAAAVLPANARDAITSVDGYTGSAGAKEKNFTSERDAEGNPTYRAERLLPGQGLTIVVTWPKGLIAPLSWRQQAAWFLKDNRALVVGGLGLAAILFYYVIVWAKVGRDPARGTIMPVYDPPDNLSPAAMRYLEHMGFDNKTFTSAILDLAAKGYLSIDRDESHTYRLIRKENAEQAEKQLSAEERVLAKKLFESGSPLYLDQEKHMLLQRARKSLEFNLQARMEGNYFVTNARYLWPGVVLTIGMIAAVAVMGGSGITAGPALFMTVLLTIWTLGVSALLAAVYRAWKSAATAGFAGTAGALFLTLFSIPFLGGEAAGAYMLWKFGSETTFFLVASALGLNVLFHHLLKRPTYTGRKLLDRIDGFKMFLGEVDGKRLDTMTPPNKTPELFERFLPYALALDVENKWAQQFSGVLAAAATTDSSQGAGYSPSWYTGGGIAAFSALAFTASFENSFSSALATASASPSSSSSGSGGGGSSGGGGGGGGVGGW